MKGIKILKAYKIRNQNQILFELFFDINKQVFGFLKIVLSVKLFLFFGRVRCFNQVDFYEF